MNLPDPPESFWCFFGPQSRLPKEMARRREIKKHAESLMDDPFFVNRLNEHLRSKKEEHYPDCVPDPCYGCACNEEPFHAADEPAERLGIPQTGVDTVVRFILATYKLPRRS